VSEELIGAAALTSRYVVAFVFLSAAVPKLLDRRGFQRAVANYDLLPLDFVGPVAAWLPRLELACALALILGVAVTPVAAASGLLLLMFAIAVAMTLARGRRIECGCLSSVAPRRIGWSLVAGDLVLAAMAFGAAVADPAILTLVSEESASPVSSGDGVALLTLAGTLVLGYHLVSTWSAVASATRDVHREAARP
jgi:putative oxidoreductase